MIRFLPAALLLPIPAFADVPRVMTDIAPIHSLTAKVMGELGTPDLLLPPGADPHDFALRPSDAQNLGDADIVIWVGAGLTPWLDEPLETLAETAVHLSLLETDGWDQLPIRTLDSFKIAADEHDDHDDHGHDDHGHDDHGHDDHGHDDHAEDDHSDHAHDDHKDHDDHAHDHGHDHDHDHGDFDPHAWLDPSIAGIWMTNIAAELGQIDPENAATYQANADAAIAEMTALEAQITATLSAAGNSGYLLPHDGYQYFETRFGLTATGAIAGIDGNTPGPAQISALREIMAEQSIACVFSDVAIGDRWSAVITEGTDANTAQIDGIGLGLEAGPALYDALLTRLADDFATCLGGAS